MLDALDIQEWFLRLALLILRGTIHQGTDQHFSDLVLGNEAAAFDEIEIQRKPIELNVAHPLAHQPTVLH